MKCDNSQCNNSLNSWPNHTETTCPACLLHARRAEENEVNLCYQDIGMILERQLRGIPRATILEGIKRLAHEVKMKREGWRRIGASWEHTTAATTAGFITIDDAVYQMHYEAGTTPPPF